MMAPDQPAAALGGPPARLLRDPKTGRMLPRAAGHPETPVNDEPETAEIPEDTEADEEETPESAEPAPVSSTGQALAPQSLVLARVKALVDEALRLGQQHHLIEQQPDGAFLLAGAPRRSRRESSDCTCPACARHDQRHWWCVVCSSGPHDWMMVKPQYERQTLKPGGIEGVRQAACSAQCARDFLATLGRQPSGIPTSQTIDPTLALP